MDPASEDTVAAEPDGTEPELPRGAVLGRYTILDRVGGGGMAVVYAAYDPELDRKVAIKLLRPGVSGTDSLSGGRGRLLREAQALARLSHPNVIAVHDVGSYADQVFVAVDLVDGVTLKQWLAARPRPFREVLAMYAQAGRGLAAAHAAGLVHRDFKPDNVIVDHDERARVLDFGLVQALGQPVDGPSGDQVRAPDAPAPLTPDRLSALDVSLTQSGMLMGTPAYMSPEQLRHGRTDARTDQFSFCVALHEALYGQRPFHSATLGEQIEKMQRGEVPPPPRHGRVPRRIFEVLRRGLRVKPEERYPSMDALLAELGRDPAQRMRRLGAAAATVALLLGLVLAVRASERRRSHQCRGAAEQLAQAWNAERREAMRRAFAATGAPYAGDAFAHAAAALDDYARRWEAARIDACEATRVRGEQSEERLEQRVACLDDRREELRALTELLGHADRGLVQRAAAAVQGQAAVEDCAVSALLRDGPRVPADAAVRARADAIYRELAAVRALFNAGRYAEARKLAPPLAARAAALHHRPLEAEVLLIQGRLEGRGDAPAQALPVLEAALEAALAGRSDDTAARALVELATAADGLNQTERGLAWAAYAAALDERLGDPPALRAHVEQARGDLCQSQARWAEAAAHYHAALAAIERSGGSPANRGAVHNNLALVYEGQGKLVEALAEAEAARALFEAGLGPQHPTLVTIVNNVGYYQLMLGRGDEARPNIERALAIGEAALGPDHVTLALPLYNLCQLALDADRFDEAQARCQRALDLRRRALGEEHPQVAGTLSLMSDIARHRGDLPAARRLAERAFAIEEKALGPRHPDVLHLLVALGAQGVLEHHPERALAPLRRAIPDLTAPEQRFDLAWARFLLERAELESGQGDRVRTRAAAEAARATLAPVRISHTDWAESLDRWLREHP
jgi:tetratricopeptide (TPR) repeat protein